MTKPDFEFDESIFITSYLEWLYPKDLMLNRAEIISDCLKHLKFKNRHDYESALFCARYQHKLDLEKHEEIIKDYKKEILFLKDLVAQSNGRTEKAIEEAIAYEHSTYKEQLDYMSIDVHSCSKNCTRLHCVQRREIAELKEKLLTFEGMTFSESEQVAKLKELNKELIEALKLIDLENIDADGETYAKNQIPRHILARVEERMND